MWGNSLTHPRQETVLTMSQKTEHYHTSQQTCSSKIMPKPIPGTRIFATVLFLADKSWAQPKLGSIKGWSGSQQWTIISVTAKTERGTGRQAGRWVNDWSYERHGKALYAYMSRRSQCEETTRRPFQTCDILEGHKPWRAQRSVIARAYMRRKTDSQHRTYRAVNYFVQLKRHVTDHPSKPKERKRKHQQWLPCELSGNTLWIQLGRHHGGSWQEGGDCGDGS